MEYKEGNDSSRWFVAAHRIPATNRVYLFKAELVNAEVSYDFRMFAYGAQEYSEAAYVSKTYNIGKFSLFV